MTYQKKYIEDKDGNRVLPITHFSAVKDSEGNSLEDVLWEEQSYDPQHYSGMGKVVLQKNMVSDVNTLTQSMINQANTIYVIKYDFVLGENITVPSSCILEFDGGSFSNVNKLQIQSNSVVKNGKISFADNASSCLVISEANNVTIDNCQFTKKLTDDITYQSPSSFIVFIGSSNNVTITNCDLKPIDNCQGIYIGGSSYNCKISENNIVSELVSLSGDFKANGILFNNTHDIMITSNHIKNTSIAVYALPMTGDNYSTVIENNIIEEVIEHGMCFYHPNETYKNYNVTINKNHVHHVYGKDESSFGTGIYILNSSDFIVSNNTIHDVCINTSTTTLAPAGIGVNESDNCILTNNIIYNSGMYGIILDGNNTKMIGNYVYNCTKNCIIRKAVKDVVIAENTIISTADNQALITSPNTVVQNARIIGNFLKSPISAYAPNCKNSVIEGNIFISTGTAAFNATNENSIIANNYIEATTSNTIPAMYSQQTNCIIKGNHIVNNNESAPHLRTYEVTNCTIEGNVFNGSQHQYDVLPANYNKSGTTSARPKNPNAGTFYNDTTVGKPIWWNGTAWVDATGATV